MFHNVSSAMDISKRIKYLSTSSRRVDNTSGSLSLGLLLARQQPERRSKKCLLQMGRAYTISIFDISLGSLAGECDFVCA